jgi:hypothetical protein
MILTGQNQNQKTCPSATLSNTNLTKTDPGAHPGLHSDRLVTNHLSHGMAFPKPLNHTSVASHSTTMFSFKRERCECKVGLCLIALHTMKCNPVFSVSCHEDEWVWGDQVAYNSAVQFQALLAMSIKITVFWVVVSCSTVELSNVSEVVTASAFKVISDHHPDNRGSKHFWNAVTFYKTTQQNNPDDSHLTFIALHFFNLDTRCRWVGSFKL